jgi:hypothetical protein
MNDLGLGKLITDPNAARDAVHVAIMPVTVAQMVYPSQRVGVIDYVDGQYLVGPSATPIGIIDPFLAECVWPKQRCYLWLTPGTITNLRHHWEHPAFPAAARVKAVSEAWLRQFAASISVSYEGLMDAVPTWSHGVFGSVRGERLEGAEGFDIPPEFWDHYEYVTGKASQLRGATSFMCGCGVPAP